MSAGRIIVALLIVALAVVLGLAAHPLFFLFLLALIVVALIP